MTLTLINNNFYHIKYIYYMKTYNDIMYIIKINIILEYYNKYYLYSKDKIKDEKQIFKHEAIFIN